MTTDAKPLNVAGDNGHRALTGTSGLAVSYVTMQFPAPSETFACLDIAELTRRGVSIRVHALRGPHPKVEQLIGERNLAAIPISHSSWRAILRGMLRGLKRPVLSLQFILWILMVSWRRPIHLIKALALVPRALDIHAEISGAKPDVVHIYWGHFPSLVGYLVRRTMPRTVVTLSLVAYDLHMRFGGSKWLAQRADAVRTVARENVKDIETDYAVDPQKVIVIYDGTDIATLNRTQESIVKIPRRMVTTGRLIPSKGMDDVLTAFARIHHEWPDATLVVLGDGPQRARLEQLASDLGVAEGVIFRGHVSQSEVAIEMARSELFVFLSWSERLPNVVKEAMASRCLCIVSRTPGIEELCEDGKHGFLVPLHGIDETVDRTRWALSNPTRVGVMLKDAKAHIESRFDVSQTAGEYETLWRRLIVEGNDGTRVP